MVKSKNNASPHIGIQDVPLEWKVSRLRSLSLGVLRKVFDPFLIQ